MPYKDKEQQKEAVKRAVQKHREGITQEPAIPTEPDIPVIPDVIPKLSPEWAHVREFISRPQSGRMTNLEKMQRVAGSLGKNAGDVWVGGLTMEDIGEVIETLPAAISKDYR